MDNRNPKRGPARKNRNTRNEPKKYQLRQRVQNEINAASDLYLNGNMTVTGFVALVKDGKAVLDAHKAAQEDVFGFLADARKKIQVAAIKSE
tara:strand:+ start:774 stop:1049 length:276 start_codon:yes stop_codon:yes gene_type:complete